MKKKKKKKNFLKTELPSGLKWEEGRPPKKKYRKIEKKKVRNKEGILGEKRKKQHTMRDLGEAKKKKLRKKKKKQGR